jgi:hypothetical protein
MSGTVLVLGVLAAIDAGTFRCPRCTRFFARWDHPFFDGCVHCGIRIGTPKSAADELWK